MAKGKSKSSSSKSSEQVLLKKLRRPKKVVVLLRIYESQYPGMLTRNLLEQVQRSSVRMKRWWQLPPKSFTFSFEYTTEAGKVEVTVPVTGPGGPWRFDPDAILGVKIPEVTDTPDDLVSEAVPGYCRQILPRFPAWQHPKFPSTE